MEIYCKRAFEKSLDAIPEGFEPTESQVGDLSINTLELYLRFRRNWYLGNIFFEWIKQCRVPTSNNPLQPFLSNIWPDNLDIFRFVNLVNTKGSEKICGSRITESVGTRRMFDRVPGLGTLSLDTLVRQETLAIINYDLICETLPERTLFPPERFNFQIVEL